MGFLSDRGKAATENTSAQFFSPNKIPLGKTARIRILSPQPLEGYQTWGSGPNGARKAFRFSDAPLAADIDAAFGTQYQHGINSFTNEPETTDFFIAVAIWDYAAQSVRIMQVTQKTLMRAIDEIASKPDYTPIQDWDLEIKREEKAYFVLPLPVSPLTRADVGEQWAATQADGFSLATILQLIPPVKQVRDATGLAGGRVF